jgi:outer membrane protein assembly factor BamA
MLFLSHDRLFAIRNRRRTHSLFAVLLFVLLVPAPPTPAQGAKKMRLSKIEFSGLQTHTESQAIAASGLEIGQTIDIPALDEAAQRLLDSGLIKKLSYRYRTTGEDATVTFQVEEEKAAGDPVVFENFIWFSDEELMAAIRQQVPDFNGTAPDSAIDGITKALQRLIREKKIGGRVDYLMSANPTGGDSKHVFSIEGVTIPICTLHYEGASSVQESELLKSSKDLSGGDYRQQFVLAYARVNLIPIYRERGHLRASFSAPQAKPESAGNCQNGAAVTVPVAEGQVFNWDKAEWAGNAALSNSELSAALDMKAGELANGLKIDKGLAALYDTYGHKGYLTARIKAVPTYAETTGQVSYNINITEGPQYHMGNFIINGMPENIAKPLRNSWKLKTGDVYDSLYLDKFMDAGIKALMPALASLTKKLNIETKPDREKLTVDVIVSLK